MKEIKKNKQNSCYHCGENCSINLVQQKDKFFCCEGCKQVYNILNSNGLSGYYAIDEYQGVSMQGTVLSEYAYLDIPNIQEKIVEFSQGNISKVRFYLPQIHCSSCIWLLENLYRLKGGISSSKVNFPRKELSIIFENSEMSLRELVELLVSIGYAPKINLGELDDSSSSVSDKSLYYKLGLAGFAFGNIMLMSFPEYLGLAQNDESSLSPFFIGLNFLLVLPVVFYSGWDYLSSAWIGIKKRHLNIDVPISMGIMALFGRSLYEVFTLTGIGYFDSLAGLIFFLLIGKWFQQKTYKRLSFDRDYKSYFPISITIIKDGQEITETINRLEVGDRILVRHGELIPTDAILKKGKANIDYSFVSGESEPVNKILEEKIFAGGRQMGGAIELIVIKKITQSYLTQLWNDDSFNKANNTNTSSRITDKIARNFTWIVLVVALLTFLYWYPKNPHLAFNTFTAVLIVACPCALALAAPFIYGNVIRILGARHLYLKNTSVIEKIKHLNHIVFDKTGTITSTKLDKLNDTNISLSQKEQQYIKSLTYHSSHPVSRAIFQSLGPMTLLEIQEFQEELGQGIQGLISGNSIRVGSKQFLGIQSDRQGAFVEINGQYRGFYEKKDQYRVGLDSILQFFARKASYSLISGDNNKEKDRLLTLFGKDTELLFNQLPKDKLDYVKSLQTRGKRVMMIGDGLNDAGALKQSEVGLVITEDVGNFTPACDVILDAQYFAQLPQLIKFSQQSINLLYVAYVISLIYNIIGLSYAVQGLLSPVIAAILMPLSSITILLFGIISTNILAYSIFGKK